jgi:hypothetical protein
VSTSVLVPADASTMEGEIERIRVRATAWHADGTFSGLKTVRILARTPQEEESERLLVGMMSMLARLGEGDVCRELEMKLEWDPVPGEEGTLMWVAHGELELGGGAMALSDRWRRLGQMMAVFR